MTAFALAPPADVPILSISSSPFSSFFERAEEKSFRPESISSATSIKLPISSLVAEFVFIG